MALVPFPSPHPSGPVNGDPDEPELLGAGVEEADEIDGATEGQMSFLEHLDELRVRLTRSCIAVILGVVATFAFIQPIFDFLLTPTRRALPPGVKLIYTQPGEAF